MNKIEKILEESFEYLRRYVNVLNVNIGEEVSEGTKTGKQAIVVYVSKKKKLSQLKNEDILPDEIEGIPVDVVELSGDFELGQTRPSKLLPSIQKRISGGVKNDKK
jgi:hypothetical protein